MRCPICPESQLIMTDRQGIEVDYCPQCRGVWLDRGELDKIIERSQSAMPAAPAAQPTVPVTVWPGSNNERNDPRYRDDHRHDHDDDHRHGYRRKKRGGFLGDIFDFS